MSKVDKWKGLTKKKSQEEVQGKEAKVKLLTDPNAELDTKAESQTIAIPQTKTHANLHAESQSEIKVESNLEAETKSEIKKKSLPDAESDPAAELLSRVGTKKKRMEDERKRRTYWLTDEEIKIIDKLAKMTGMDKYEVVGLAVKSMYHRVLNSRRDQ